MPGEAINSPQDFSVSVTVSIHSSAGLEIKFWGAQLHRQEVMCIETNTSLVYLQKSEEAAVEFKGALGARYPLISSPVVIRLQGY